MTTPDPLVFLLDVDNTLLDNDRIVADLGDHLAHEFGDESRDIATGKFSRRCALISAMRSIWAPCSATVSAPGTIRAC